LGKQKKELKIQLENVKGTMYKKMKMLIKDLML
jgi:hypothetical protein